MHLVCRSGSLLPVNLSSHLPGLQNASRTPSVRWCAVVIERQFPQWLAENATRAVSWALDLNCSCHRENELTVAVVRQRY